MTSISAYPKSTPHGPVEEIFTDIFWVHGSINMGRGAKFNRNMVIVREGTDLTLINAVRLDDDQPIQDLGTVKHVVRLGCFHGLDDPYYVDTYGADFWAFDNQHPSYKDKPKPKYVMGENMPAPFSYGEVFQFHDTKWSEGALLVKRHGGVLITCDAIQHHKEWSRASMMTRIMLPFLGFTKTTLIGPLWLKAMTKEGGSLKADFERLLTLDFEHGVGAHGQVTYHTARREVEQAVANAFS